MQKHICLYNFQCLELKVKNTHCVYLWLTGISYLRGDLLVWFERLFVCLNETPFFLYLFTCVYVVCERKEHSLRLICGVEWVCLFFLWNLWAAWCIWHLRDRPLLLKTSPETALSRPSVCMCVCVCMGLCLHIRAAKHCHRRGKKYTQIHWPFFKYPSLLSWDTFWHQQWVCVKLSVYLCLFLLRIHFVSFSPFSSALFFPSFHLVSLRPLSQNCPWIVHVILFCRFLFDSLPVLFIVLV